MRVRLPSRDEWGGRGGGGPASLTRFAWPEGRQILTERVMRVFGIRETWPRTLLRKARNRGMKLNRHRLSEPETVCVNTAATCRVARS